MNIFEISKQLFYSGGIIILPLGIVSFFIWYLLVYRSFELLRNPFSPSDFITQIGNELKKGLSPETMGIYSKLQGLELEMIRGFNGVDIDQLRPAVEHSFRRCVELVHSDNRFVRTLINVALLLGLLGTVIGMLETFRIIGIVGTSEPQLLARGISLAMITTQIGLIIAVPALFFERQVRRLEEKVLYNLEEMKLVLLQCFSDKGQ